MGSRHGRREKTNQHSRKRATVPQGEKACGVVDHLGRAAAGRGHYRDIGGHGLQQHHPEGLMVGTQHKQIERLEATAGLRNLAEKADRRRDAKGFCPRFTLPGPRGAIWRPFISENDIVSALPPP